MVIPFLEIQPDSTKVLTERLRGVDRDYWTEADFDEEVAAWERVESESAQKRALIQWVVEKLQPLSAAHPPDTSMMDLAKLLPEPERGAVITICRDVFNARHRELQALLCCDPAADRRNRS